MTTAIITGDIIKSQGQDPEHWMETLKSTLSNFGASPKNWELYRGDSFQLETTPKTALYAALLIKAHLKQYSNLEVRLAIGIGEKTFETNKITESNGSAFVNSGICFENLKKNTLAIKTQHEHLNHSLNLMFELASLTIANWTSAVAELIAYALAHPDHNQQRIAKHQKTTQSNVSQGLKRGGFDELSKLLQYYQTQIETLC
jgi:hypothetical protein